MNQFDYSSKIAIGQYQQTGSILHRFDPRVKISGFFFLIMALTLSRSLIGILFGLAFAIIGIIIAQIPFRMISRSILLPMPFLLIIAINQMLIYPDRGGSVLLTIGSFQLSELAVLSAGLLILRFIALILTISLMSATVSSSEMIHGLQQLLKPLNKLGIHTMDFVMIIQIALRFLPLLAITAERIAKAQASKGADWGTKNRSIFKKIKQIIPLIIPLFTISLRRAESLALAMDARAYGYQAERTSMTEYHFRTKDAYFGSVCLIAAALIILL